MRDDMRSLKDLSRDLKTFQRDIEQAANRANRRIGEIALAEAKKRSRGSFSTAILSAAPPGLNHPYGIGPHNARGDRGFLPYGDESVVNRQTGLFYRSWRLAPGMTLARVPLLILQNDAPYARFLEHGTNDMIARPVDVAIRTKIDEVASKIAADEFSRAWKVRFDTK